jgi:hypothetical protein
MSTGAVSLRVKRQGREADQSPPSRAEEKNVEATPPILYESPWCDAQLFIITVIFTFV